MAILFNVTIDKQSLGKSYFKEVYKLVLNAFLFFKLVYMQVFVCSVFGLVFVI